MCFEHHILVNKLSPEQAPPAAPSVLPPLAPPAASSAPVPVAAKHQAWAHTHACEQGLCRATAGHYVCMCARVCAFACVRVCVHLHVCACVCVCACAHVCVYECVYVRVCVCVCKGGGDALTRNAIARTTFPTWRTFWGKYSGEPTTILALAVSPSLVTPTATPLSSYTTCGNGGTTAAS